MFESAMVALTAIAVIGVACQWLAWFLKLPAILLLLLAGIIVGPVTGFLKPDALFGELLFPTVSLGVAVILFEGSLRLRFDEIRGLTGVIRNLVTLGALVNWLVITVASHLLLDLSWQLAALFGAIAMVTGPTVIMPMLLTIRPVAAVANVLRWEGIVLDPLGALFAVLVFEFILSGREGESLLVFLEMAAVGAGSGVMGGLAVAAVLRRHLLPDYLVNVATLAAVLGIFTFSNSIESESGLLAVTLMGMVVANRRGVPIEEVVDFKESLSVIIISALFIILAARIEVGQLAEILWPALGLLAVVLLLARPLAVALASVGSPLSRQERLLIGWVGPRGIVAAAVSALFALRLESLGVAEAALLVPLTFFVIIGTVVIQGATARPLADFLGVSEPDPKGVLIVGGGRVARAIGSALKEKGFRVVLADTDWEAGRAARMAGLEVYFGNVVSEHADRHLDRVGLGRLFALSPHAAYNALACLRFRREFGSDRVFAVHAPKERSSEKAVIPPAFSCPRLFAEDLTLAKLSSLISQGAEIRTTQLTEDFDYTTYRTHYGSGLMPLFALTPKGGLHVFSPDSRLEPQVGWSVIALMTADVVERTAQSRLARAKARE